MAERKSRIFRPWLFFCALLNRQDFFVSCRICNLYQLGKITVYKLLVFNLSTPKREVLMGKACA